MNPIGPENVTIIRTPGRDHMGDPLPGNPVEIRVPGCSIQPAATSETTTSGDTVTTTLTVWMPAGTDIRVTDHVRFDHIYTATPAGDPVGVDGGLYAVDGQPARWFAWCGHEHHVQVRLRRIDG